jgi:murein DD-endopeptidase MepM/ murein hydrolase activator NlpD
MAVKPAQYFDPFPGNRGDELGNMASYRKHPHRGSDWGIKKAIELKPIKAITNGKVKKIFWTDVLGHCLVQSSDDGYYWLYAHLAEKPALEIDSPLEGGKSVIGKVGGGAKTKSGTASTGAHLHMAGAKMADGKDVHLVAYEKLVDVHKHIDQNNKPVKAEAPAAPAANAEPAKPIVTPKAKAE